MNWGTAGKLLGAREQFQSDFALRGERYVMAGMYRVFDTRMYYYNREYLKTNSLKIMRNLTVKDNLALVAFRQQSQDGFHHVFITRQLGDKNAVSLRTREINYYFPLYVLPDTNVLVQVSKSSNLSPKFIQALQSDALRQVNPDGAFSFIYAVLHSPSYRARYADFLKTDFPRIPLPGGPEVFDALVPLGAELVALHLMESPALNQHITTLAGADHFVDGNDMVPVGPVVEKVSFANGTVYLDKKQSIGFQGVPEVVWNFHIGGYQVCEKWLKDRGPKGGKPGRVLSPEDIEHYHRIVVALSETIRIMAEIDVVIEEHGGWPGAFSK